MRTGIIVQARMSSKRCPGKVLKKVAGKPMLKYTLERLAKCSFQSALVVATSMDKTDEALQEFCTAEGINCYRGALHDVAGRFVGVIKAYDLDCFVRTNGDSPLIDPRLIEEAVAVYSEGKYDLVTNVMPRTYPFGQSVEVVNAETFLAAYELMSTAEEREHVTKHFYNNSDMYRIRNIESSSGYEGLRVCVDTFEDMDLFAKVVQAMDRPQEEYSLGEVSDLYIKVNGAGGAK